MDGKLQFTDSSEDRWAQHVDDILKHTITREWHYTRGSRMAGDEEDEARESQLRRAGLLRSVLTGDPRSPTVQVLRTDGRREDVVDSVSAAFVEAGLLLGVISNLPAKNRWGSVAEHLAQEVAGNTSEEQRRPAIHDFLST